MEEQEQNRSSRSQPCADAQERSLAEQRSGELKPSEVLERAAALIEQPGAWTQGWFAKDADGESVASTADTAVCWCALGSVRRVSRYSSTLRVAERALQQAIHRDEVDEWNDAPGRTQAEVVDALKRAAELARSEGQ